MRPALIASGLVLVLSGCTEVPNQGPDVYCLDASWCADNPGYPRCDTALHRCTPEPGRTSRPCSSDSACSDASAPVCDATDHVCRPCQGSADDGACALHGQAAPLCVPDTGRCGACRADTDCSIAGAPVCDAGRCRACRAHAECPSGVCSTDGTCLAASDVAYVDNKGMICVAGPHSGTRQDPYCEIFEAVARIGERKVIRVAGSIAPYHGVTTGGTITPIRIIGPGRTADPPALLSDPDKPCLDVAPNTLLHAEGLVLSGCKGGVASRQATVTLRGCTIRESLGPAVELRGSDRPHILDGNVIVDNKVGGGITLFSILDFDIRNNFIASNFNGLVGKTGGVYIDAISGGRFAFNTLRNNRSTEVAGGIACEGHVDNTRLAFSSSILVGNTMDAQRHQWSERCAPTDVVVGVQEMAVPGTRAIDPEWVSAQVDYRLRGSPNNAGILDAVPAVDLDHDIDGNPRPAGKAADVGCFEVP